MVIGSGWKKKDRDGNVYVSCVIQLPFLGEINFALFSAKEKKSENSPDWSIVWSQKRKDKPAADAMDGASEDPFA